MLQDYSPPLPSFLWPSWLASGMSLRNPTPRPGTSHDLVCQGLLGQEKRWRGGSAPPPSSSGCRTRNRWTQPSFFPRALAWARLRRWRGEHISGTKITWYRAQDSRIALGSPPGVCFYCTFCERGAR